MAVGLLLVVIVVSWLLLFAVSLLGELACSIIILSNSSRSFNNSRCIRFSFLIRLFSSVVASVVVGVDDDDTVSSPLVLTPLDEVAEFVTIVVVGFMIVVVVEVVVVVGGVSLVSVRSPEDDSSRLRARFDDDPTVPGLAASEP